MNVRLNQLPVAVIGAGPVGLAAAAHLVQRGFMPIVLEEGPSIASSLESYRQVKLFSPWRYNIDHVARALLDSSDWQAPDLEALPAAGEIVDNYLKPLAALPAIAPHVKLNHQVTHISRQGFDKVKTKGRDAVPFVLRVRTPDGEHDVFAQAVIDAAGTWTQPNPLGANGLPALNEARFSASISYGMPDILGADRTRYAGKRVLVVGAGHSAAGNLIALAELAEQAPGTTLIWAIRGNDPSKTFGGGEADGLPARGRLGMRLKQLQESGRLELHMNYRIRELCERATGFDVVGEPNGGTAPVIEGVEEVIAATGARPNLEITRELRLKLDPWLESTDALAPLIDPNLHSCGTVRPHGHQELAHPEQGYYAVGAKSYGRAPNFLMATGYEQVRSVVAALAGDIVAANDMQLELPEAGVCTVRSLLDESAQSSGGASCDGPAKSVQAESLPASSPAGDGGCGSKACAERSAGGVVNVQEESQEDTGCGCRAARAAPVKTAPAGCCG